VIISEQERNRILRLHRDDFILKEGSEGVRNKIKSNQTKIVDLISEHLKKELRDRLTADVTPLERILLKVFIDEDNLIEQTINTWKPYLTKLVEEYTQCILNQDSQEKYMLSFINDTRKIVDEKIKGMGWGRKKLIKGAILASGGDISDEEELTSEDLEDVIGHIGYISIGTLLFGSFKDYRNAVLKIGGVGGNVGCTVTTPRVGGQVWDPSDWLKISSQNDENGVPFTIEIVGKVDKAKIEAVLMKNVREINKNVLETLKT